MFVQSYAMAFYKLQSVQTYRTMAGNVSYIGGAGYRWIPTTATNVIETAAKISIGPALARERGAARALLLRNDDPWDPALRYNY